LANLDVRVIWSMGCKVSLSKNFQDLLIEYFDN
jgi:hypothetical protein